MKRSVLIAIAVACALLTVIVFVLPMFGLRPATAAYEKAAILPTGEFLGSKDDGLVVGVVSDAAGAPISGARVRILDRCFSDSDLDYERRVSANDEDTGVSSNSSGEFQLLWVRPGLYRVCAVHEGTIPAVSSVFEVAAGKRTVLPRLELVPIRPDDLIHGVVVTESGAPVVGATVILTAELRTFGNMQKRSDVVQSDDAGAFRFLVVLKAPHQVSVYARNAEPVASVDAVAPGTSNVRLVVP